MMQLTETRILSGTAVCNELCHLKANFSIGSKIFDVFLQHFVKLSQIETRHILDVETF